MSRPELQAGDYRLRLAPAVGGAVAGFEWRGQPLLRPMLDDYLLSASCFPLVPFANRIAAGRFVAAGRAVQLAPTFPADDPINALHGYGWISAWEVAELGRDHAVLTHRYAPGDWPWPYNAEQRFELTEAGLMIAVSLRNLGNSPMPAGLGLHPYFPREADSRYIGLHSGEWQSGADGLPIALDARATPRDWWAGQPVGSRVVDTVYAGRQGPLTVQWPQRRVELEIRPSAILDHTAVYAPADADFFCIEPMSHATDAINRGAMAWLEPGATLEASVTFQARELD